MYAALLVDDDAVLLRLLMMTMMNMMMQLRTNFVALSQKVEPRPRTLGMGRG